MVRKAVLVTAIGSIGVAGIVSSASAASGKLVLGPRVHTRQVAYRGFYDAHKDTYLVTDVSSKSQALTLHVNYSKALAGVRGAPPQYFVQGRAAAGQLAVFGSEPGESDYNPLWEELFVRWKAGVKPVLLVSDDQIKSLAKSGKLTITDAHIVLDAPITKVGK
jgi:hypothetical protein